MGDIIDTITGKKQVESQERIARERLRREEKLKKNQRIASSREADQARTATQAASRLAKARGTQASNVALAQKGIKKRPLASFSDISRAVLDEGNV